MAWVAVGVGTLLLATLAVYWQEVKKWFRRREVVNVVKQQQERAPDLTVSQIVQGGLAWAGCMRYLYINEDRESGGVVWAQSEQGARVALERRGQVPLVIWRAEWETPAEDDLFVFDEEV